MIEPKLDFKKILLLASLIFGMFFGSGNLIFPAHLGQLAGHNWLSAGSGFLLSATILPLLALLALGITRSNGIYDLAKPIAPWYAMLFLIFAHFSLGPAFVTPRVAATAYQFTLGPWIPAQYTLIATILFSATFFILTYLFSAKEIGLTKYIGKIMNPIFLTLLAIVVIVALLHPFGNLNGAPADPLNYAKAGQSIASAFIEGYNTMDALAALAFGITIMRAIQGLGFKKPASIAKATAMSGALAILGMGIIYIILIALGSMSLSKFHLAANGGITLQQIIQYYFGSFGLILFAGIAILAMLTTAIGLVAAFAQDFHRLFPILSYKQWLLVTTGLSFITTNFGLDTIIKFSLPLLMLLYPLAMALIFPSLLSPLFGNKSIVYKITTGFTIIPALLDALANSGLASQHWATGILDIYHNTLPFASIGLGWTLPTLLGLIIGIIIAKLQKPATPSFSTN
ncbi:MAG: branched-chain amino acid transport system II carrier protein [Lactobacillaceae bacterium]|jgi:LIVCS family branched-chain amino acid:cation transporter|nr:branched-chain amino acid transport system II carrier protein [Lactobacillaceae bacterium]